MTDFAMTVGGTPVSGARGFDVIDPATTEVFAQAPDCGADELDQAMNSAAKAFGDWREDDAARRGALAAAADALVEDAHRLVPVLTAEQGKPLADARQELAAAVAWLRYYAALELPREIVQDDERGFAEVLHRPLGVVAAIAPWNFPLTLAAWKIGPALRAGNTMVLKPSPYTPLATLAMGETLGRALPPGVLNVVSGREPLGARMAAHPIPRKISLTGSTETGKKVAAAVAGDLKRLTLELGGNDPAIVLEDADPRQIAETLFWGGFMNNGQWCSAVKRVYAPARIYTELVEALAEQAETVRVGNGVEEGVQLGPVNNRRQFDRVGGLVADALGHGAVAAAGGGPGEGPGYFYPPTILSGAEDGMPVVDEEQFGPVMPVVAYRDLEDAVARANGTHFGLTASVWSPDLERADAVARRLECGQVSVNVHGGGMRPDLPFSGHKWSGVGVENGVWGLRAFTDIQALIRPARRPETVRP